MENQYFVMRQLIRRGGGEYEEFQSQTNTSAKVSYEIDLHSISSFRSIQKGPYYILLINITKNEAPEIFFIKTYSWNTTYKCK
jgi:hypothetical protein